MKLKNIKAKTFPPLKEGDDYNADQDEKSLDIANYMKKDAKKTAKLSEEAER